MTNGNSINKPRQPSYKSVGPYKFMTDAISKQTKDEIIDITSGIAWIEYMVIDGEHRYAMTCFRSPQGEVTTELISATEMSQQKLAEIAFNRGVVVLKPLEFANFFKLLCASEEVKKAQMRTRLSRPGWVTVASTVVGFYTGNVFIIKEGNSAEGYYCEQSSEAPMRLSGTFASWHTEIGLHIERNPLPLVLACIGLASPLLPRLNLSSRLTNVYGGKGTGKTLATQMAASLFGNGIDPAAGMTAKNPAYVTKFETTANGLESLLARYSPNPIFLDEMTEQSTNGMGNLMYKAASGASKERMTSALKPAPKKLWHLNIISTAERSIADAVTSSGQKLLGGQADRAIDIPVSTKGVLTDLGDFADFASLTRHLKAACGRYYGRPARKFIKHILENPDCLNELVEQFPMIEECLIPQGCGDGERRVVKHFTAGLIAGVIAIEAGIFTCSVEVLEASFHEIIDAWWLGRAECLRRIACYLEENWENVTEERPDVRLGVKAYINGNKVIIPVKDFVDEFGSEEKTIIEQLVSLNALIREQPNRNKSRFCNNEMFAYVVDYIRVQPFITQIRKANKIPARAFVSFNDVLV